MEIGFLSRVTPSPVFLTYSGLQAQMICFFVFLVLNGLMLMLDIPKWKRLVWTKVLVFAVSSAGMLALAITKAGGKVGCVPPGASPAQTLVTDSNLFVLLSAPWSRGVVPFTDRPGLGSWSG